MLYLQKLYSLTNAKQHYRLLSSDTSCPIRGDIRGKYKTWVFLLSRFLTYTVAKNILRISYPSVLQHFLDSRMR